MERASALIALISLALPPAAPAGDVVIDEIHYNPEDKTAPEEFVELHNRGDVEIDLSGWFFSEGIRYAFPPGTRIAPGGTIVVAEDPEALADPKGMNYAGALGPYEGRLANDGERVVLRNAEGGMEDEVDYRTAFPWPIAADGLGSSMELVHPTLDNDLGGSWRASGLGDRPPRERVSLIAREDGAWHYRKGLSEASDPISAWRGPDFAEDATWIAGRTSIGYGDGDDHTVLDDMRNGYTSVYLRHTFSVDEDGGFPDLLKLGVYVDDGCIVWINGVEVARLYAREGEQPFDALAGASHEARWTDLLLRNPSAFLRPGGNVVAIHAFNRSRASSDFSIDAELYVPGSQDLGTDLFGFPTPGARNSVHAENAPPHVRRVAHFPPQPPEGGLIFVTAEVTDPQGVASVELRYQLVLPGDYIPAFLPLPHATLLARPDTPRPPNPAFEDPANWTAASMVDDGTGADQVADDGLYTAMIPGQPNRTLVRYRIAATDAAGASIIVPYRDDPSLDFACFVYEGVPPYVASRRSVHPEGAGHVYPVEVMTSLPVYILITRSEDLAECIAYSSAYQIPKSNEGARDKFNWEGAFVYEGVAYDHITYRLRQANDRYGRNGKRSFRFRFNRGHYLQARDNYGRPFPYKWRTINTGKMFDNKRVGNFGLTETMNENLWNLVGVPSPWAYTIHLRIVRGPDEVPPGSNGQYLGDFFGMHLIFEDYDPHFLDTHGLADGNLYKLKDGIFDGNELRRNQGRYAVTTDADFQNIRRNLRPERTDEWLDAHVNYEKWYPYHAVVEAIRHYDFRPSDTHSKNRAWYFEPDYAGSEYGRLWTLPWDADASWGPNWNQGIDYSKNAIFYGRGKEPYKRRYRNFIREFRDLIWTEEVIEQMIDDLAARIAEFAMADRDRWRGAPAQAGSQDFGPMESKVADMKRFAFVGWSGSTGPTVPAGGRARYLDALAAAEGEGAEIPDTPTVISTAPPDFPVDMLTFRAGPYGDPQGDPLAAMRWRIGEITPPGTPFDPEVPRIYEWPAVWEYEDRETLSDTIAIPRAAVEPGHMYRARLRVMDATGRWSHWSEPVEFVAGEPRAPSPEETGLRITEIMYHPEGDSGFEFIELCNIGGEVLDLGAVSLRGGIAFSFAEGDVPLLGPGEYVVVVSDLPAFRSRYDTAGLRIGGEYVGRLDNGRERIELIYGASAPILAFAYDDGWYPSTDGSGHSLVIRDPGAAPESWGRAESWRPSLRVGGSPGGPDVEEGGLQLPGDLNQDGLLQISDAVNLFRYLFQGASFRLPCGDGSLDDPSNRALIDVSGEGSVDIGDGIRLLNYLFAGGPPPALGTACVPLAGCPDVCVP